MDKNIGKRLDGRYEITELIGMGGMADVYKAVDTVNDKVVAVKILKKERLRKTLQKRIKGYCRSFSPKYRQDIRCRLYR